MCEYEKKIPVYDIKIIVDEDLKMKNATLENLINHRDTCMKEVYGKSYEELFKTMDKVVNNPGDIFR